MILSIASEAGTCDQCQGSYAVGEHCGWDFRADEFLCAACCLAWCNEGIR